MVRLLDTSHDNKGPGQLQVELRIKAMQLVLIPGPFTNLQETKPVGWTWDQLTRRRR